MPLPRSRFSLISPLTAGCAAARQRHVVHVMDGQFVDLGDHRLQDERHAVGVEADREVIEHDLERVDLEDLGVVEMVGQRLDVGDEDERVVFELQFDAAGEAADVMAQVKRPGRAVAGQDGFHERNLSEKSVGRLQAAPA